MKKLVLFVLILISGISFAQNDAKRIGQYNLENKVAIQGYDPVGYFNQGKAIKGKKELSASYQGIIYNFSSGENKATFLKKILQNTNLNMVDGVRMRWEAPEKKSK
ncbi:hypothetical protein [Flavobacterium psychroterrae]|uniref:hypothetical protein n=1 Tax=Flavobacterium psychroterrae TaxID=2133767 RepID=UPI001FD427FB|nr:hypothetical protein [Flavobacterium psychroterrae]